MSKNNPNPHFKVVTVIGTFQEFQGSDSENSLSWEDYEEAEKVNLDNLERFASQNRGYVLETFDGPEGLLALVAWPNRAFRRKAGMFIEQHLKEQAIILGYII